jgi:hypothetical protein
VSLFAKVINTSFVAKVATSSAGDAINTSSAIAGGTQPQIPLTA